MNNLTIAPYSAEHALGLLGKGSVEAMIGLAKAREITGPAFTLFADGEVVGCGGMDVFEGQGNAWALFGPLLQSYRKTVVRTTKIALEGIIKDCNLSRVVATADPSSTKIASWLIMLGFTNTGKIVKGTMGGTYVEYEVVVSK